MKFTHMRTPLYPMTFRNKRILGWVMKKCEGKTLNLFAGETFLEGVNEVRNDMNKAMPAKYHKDALKLARRFKPEIFQTVLLDPPYSYRKSMEFYEGYVTSPFNALKNELVRILKPKGIVITFGYHSISMGTKRGFEVEEVLIMSHGGAIHDTIATVERKVK